MTNLYTQLLEKARGMQDELTRVRRDLHRHPETGWLEMRTTSLIAQRLRALGWEVATGRAVCAPSARMGVPTDAQLREHAAWAIANGAPAAEMTAEVAGGFTGVVAWMRGGASGASANVPPDRVVALRFDIDALGMVERSDAGHRPAREGFASVLTGAMHACGHDGHAAIGLGVAQVLSELRGAFSGEVRLLFQPAEEGARGAAAMVAAGWLDGVDFFLGSHIAPREGTDDGDVTPGTFGSLATTKLDAVFTGRAAHAGGFPEAGQNALAAAAAAVLGILAIPRHSAGQSRVNVGTLRAGTGRNVVPDRAEMQIEVRGETTAINAEMARRARAACEGAALSQGCEVALTKVGEAEGQASDEALIARVAAVTRGRLAPLTVSRLENARNWGSEDISCMMNRVQAQGGLATYMRFPTNTAAPQHTVGFDFDESVLWRGVAVFAGVALALLSEEAEA